MRAGGGRGEESRFEPTGETAARLSSERMSSAGRCGRRNPDVGILTWGFTRSDDTNHALGRWRATVGFERVEA